MDIKKSTGKILRTLRGSKGWTQEKTEQETGVAYRSIQDIEAGKVQPTIVTIFKICQGFQITPHDLLNPLWDEWLLEQDKE